ncbi:Erythronate-4-phosphate dehydrogenase family protein [Zea mays]|uniref:Erythronate-4-phosphate dehydrogenase family protein n=1 Tax=Zea mays TaxID=4577 RepID=K7U0V8_MAIZE|nr:Erythronate-4-phosphate dehydrogenase family protein [Zea mays]
MADPGGCLEVRLFYVRVSPHGGAAPPPRLALELRPAGGEAAPVPLRLDRHDAASGEATYVSTAAARLPPPSAAFDVADHRGVALLRGSLRWCPGAKGGSHAWEIDCVPAAAAAASASAFEVYVAGCYAGEPAVLTHALRLATPEEAAAALVRRRSGALPAARDEGDNDMNTGSTQYPEGWYSDDDDGQLSWFNAGVRVGVGIGLGVCVGVGIGVGLLLRSYQATTRSLKRRFF